MITNFLNRYYYNFDNDQICCGTGDDLITGNDVISDHI